MEERVPCKSVQLSSKFKENRTQIYDYTFNTFGFLQAERYLNHILKCLDTLSEYYLFYPECRHLQTKSRMYRNIILDAHLIIFRITDERIEVLDIIHSASSIGKIREIRRVSL
ncbi:MAG: type II toxin-antitoxin system RelE/ParE family toxin [Bacteroidales bacterium]|jgi:plasmid stabilization system protein ParE|nr:type II toxin-antitoxin system RelE/ParE family toxin [Bacteroidales bacterium]